MALLLAAALLFGLFGWIFPPLYESKMKSCLVGITCGIVVGGILAVILGAWQHQEAVSRQVPLQGSNYSGNIQLSDGDVDEPTIIFTDNLCDDGNWGWKPLDLSISKWWWLCVDGKSKSRLLVPRGYLEPSS